MNQLSQSYGLLTQRDMTLFLSGAASEIFCSACLPIRKAPRHRPKIESTAYRDGAKTLREDIRERVIREDPLRILRAMRVVAVLGSE